MVGQFLLINWTKGAVVGTAKSADEARAQANKSASEFFRDSYIIAEVKAISETKRVWEG